MNTENTLSPTEFSPEEPLTPSLQQVQVNRREFMRLAGLGFAASYILLPVDSALAATPAVDPFSVFPLSVASGDPTDSGFVVWTCLAPKAYVASAPLLIEVASDVKFRTIVRRLQVNGSQIKPTLDYTVRVDLNNHLQANTVYYYRFIYKGVTSRTGRGRTLPAENQSLSSLKFAVVNCQDYTNGYYGAYKYIADDRNIDFVIHLGDFIYETTGNTAFQFGLYPDRHIKLPSGGQISLGLDDYRAIYKTYRSDPFLQAAMENFTWIVIWDDHELANDSYHDYANDSQGAPDHPFGNDPAKMQQLKFDSQQAWFEYTASRTSLRLDAEEIFSRLRIFRKFKFGTLVELFMTDERTYRTPHPDGEEQFGERYFSPMSAAQRSSRQTILGTSQRNWLINNISSSTSLWKAWGNEVLMAPFTAFFTPELVAAVQQALGITLKPGVLTFDNDCWDGYQHERALIAKSLKTAGVNNLVVLTGDLHSYVASYVKADYTQPSNFDQSNLLGVEFMTPAISSSNLMEQLANNAQFTALLEGMATNPALNPHMVFFNSSNYGYATVEFNTHFADYTMYSVDKTVNSATAARSILKKFHATVNKVRILDVTPSSKE